MQEDNEKKNNNYNNNNSNNPTLHEGAIIEDVPDFKMEATVYLFLVQNLSKFQEIVEDDTFDPDLCLKMEDSTPYYEEEVEVESTHYASPSTFKVTTFELVSFNPNPIFDPNTISRIICSRLKKLHHLVWTISPKLHQRHSK